MPGVLRDLIERDRDERTDMQIVGELSNGELENRFSEPLDLLILGLEDSHLPIQGERLPMHYLSPTVIGISAGEYGVLKGPPEQFGERRQ